MGEEQPENLELTSSTSNQQNKYFADFSDEFDYFYSNIFSLEKLNLIDDFIDHYEKHGLNGWKGKITPSWNVPDSYADHKKRRKYAQKFNLWHAHIGLPSWKSAPNASYLTSDHVLHFQQISNYEILLMTVSTHNPMDLPNVD